MITFDTIQLCIDVQIELLNINDFSGEWGVGVGRYSFRICSIGNSTSNDKYIYAHAVNRS